MDILMIGNGFDLAHGLPTKYENFLDWIVAQTEFFEKLQQQDADVTKNITMRLKVPEKRKNRMEIFHRIEQQTELWECISDNIWIGYFLQCEMYEQENWIDFENEISSVIQKIDDDIQKIGADENQIVNAIPVTYLEDYFLDNIDLINEIWYSEMRQALEEEWKGPHSWNIGSEAAFAEKYEADHPKEFTKEKIT